VMMVDLVMTRTLGKTCSSCFKQKVRRRDDMMTFPESGTKK
jgi:hypothetical protein